MITASTALPKGNILIVDDVPDNLTLLKKMLSGQGYKIRVAPNGRLAIQSVLAKPPDLILLDILMPDMDGYAVCQTLKANEQTCHIPIIFVSALSETFDKVKAFSMGGTDYLTKPVQIEEAIARINHQLNLNRLRQQIVDRNVELEQEIRARIQAEEQVRLLQSVVVNANDAVVITEAEPFDEPGPQILYVNEAFTKMTGYQSEDVLGKTPRILQGPRTSEATRANIRAALASWQPFRGELLNYAKDGSEFWVDLSITPLINEKGWVTHWIAIQRDVSDRKAAELVLQRQAHIINQIHDSVLTTDLRGVITSWNKGAERRFGFRNEEIIGQNFSVLCADGQDTFFQNQVIQPLLRKGEHEVELEMLPQNHDEFSAHLSLSVMKDDEGKSIGMIAYIMDISDRKRAEAEILKNLEKERELNELKTRFITMVSHEYRTPLATILSSLELLEYYGHRSTEQEMEEYFQQIRISIQRMTDLLNDVLTIEKSEAGKFTFNPEPLDLRQFCQDLVTELQGNIKTEHRILLAIEGQCSQAQMDKKLMRHIFSNLISNAVKYSPQGGTIRFEVICQGSIATFCVGDQGIGIPSEAIQNLFQSFFRANNVGNIAGTGLGLSIVKQLVEIHAGSISVESQLGSGTTFVVALPLKPKSLLTRTS